MKVTVFSFVLFLVLLNSGTRPKEISIDVSKTETIFLSVFADKGMIIPLKTAKTFKRISNVSYLGNFIYVMVTGEDQNTTYNNILQFDNTGKFINNLGEEETNSQHKIRNLLVNHDRKELYVVLDDKYLTYNYSGKYLSSTSLKLDNTCICFDNKIWQCESVFKDNRFVYSVVRMELDGKSRKTIYSYTSLGAISLVPRFFNSENKLYFYPKEDRTLYEVNPDKLIPLIKFKFKNKPEDKTSDFRAPECNLFSDYFFLGYEIKLSWYGFIYNLKTGKSFNTKFGNMTKGMNDGIMDDLYKSGVVFLNSTNNDDYLYFHKKANDLPAESPIDTPGTKDFIFLVKAKKSK